MQLTAKTKQYNTMNDVDVAIQKPITKFCMQCHLCTQSTTTMAHLCLSLLTRKLLDGFVQGTLVVTARDQDNPSFERRPSRDNLEQVPSILVNCNFATRLAD